MALMNARRDMTDEGNIDARGDVDPAICLWIIDYGVIKSSDSELWRLKIVAYRGPP